MFENANRCSRSRLRGMGSGLDSNWALYIIVISMAWLCIKSPRSWDSGSVRRSLAVNQLVTGMPCSTFAFMVGMVPQTVQREPGCSMFNA